MANPAKLFWNWFEASEKKYRQFSNNGTEAADQLLDNLLDHLKPYDPWLKCLVGKANDGQNELIITADGDIALFTKVEALVAAAPRMAGWIFTAHKPACGMGISISYNDEEFNSSTLRFYPHHLEGMPDEISIVVTHPRFKASEESFFRNAAHIYLENSMGELAVALDIDELAAGPIPADIETIPIEKLPDYITWRKKEFVEKYSKLHAYPLGEEFTVLKATSEGNKPLTAIVNSQGNSYDFKPAFPWCVEISCKYVGDSQGLPGKKQLDALQELEDAIIHLPGMQAGTLYLAAETFDNCRTLYFYASDFRQPSTTLHHFFEQHKTTFDCSFYIVKDKYWQKLQHFYENIQDH